ncbi:MAG: hypothetical protein WC389_22625 [Lutibacter sp.]|jgi:hypothetical protein
MEKENIDKLVRSIKDGVGIYQDVKKAKEDDGKISFVEGSEIVLKNAGKAVRFISSINEIGKEVVDLESDEAAELVEALVLIYDFDDPLIKSGSTKILEGLLKLKEGIEEIVEAVE